MYLTKKRKINLSKEDILIVENMSEEARLLYNNLLAQKNNYFKETGKNLSYYELQKTLKHWDTKYLTFDQKKEVCRILDANFKSFFELFKKHKDKNPRKPRFRGKDYFFTISCVQDFIFKNNEIHLSLKDRKELKIPFKCNEFCQLDTTSRNKSKNVLKQLKLSKEDSEYFISIVYEHPEKSTVETNKILSIDLGKKNLVTFYDMENEYGCTLNSKKYYENEKYFDKRIEEVQAKRDKKVKNSRKWKQLNNKKRNLEKKKYRQNKLHLHILSKKISKLDRDIVIGELTNLKQNIVSEHKRLNKQMQNNWQLKTFVDLLDYKCKKEGRELTKVNEAWTSKTCCFCGNINHGLTPSIRTYKCECCGNVIDRDINGAINILKVYLGDYNTPSSVKTEERFFGNYQKMNQFCIDLNKII